MAAQIPDSFLDLFDKETIAYLAVHLKDQRMMVNPVWCSLDGGDVLINSVQGRAKDRMMRANPSVTLCITDPDSVFRYLEVRGTVTDITTDGADDHIDELSERYLGHDSYPFRKPEEKRVIYRIRPDEVKSMSLE